MSDVSNSPPHDNALDDELDDLFGGAAPTNDSELLDKVEEAEEEAPAEELSAEASALQKMPKFKRAVVRNSPTTEARPEEAESPSQAEPESALMDDEEEESRPSEPINPKQAEIDELNRRIDAALKSGRARKRRKADEDDVAIDESIANLRKRMRDAAYRDIDDNKDGLPAIHKMGMLTDVTDELRKTHLYEAFLENNIVDSLRLWLEPLDDGSLPALDIQNALLDILGKLPVRRDHLRESGIGKIIMFMSKCPRIPERNRRVCEQFVQRWSRMVMKLSSNFRDRKIRETKVNLDRRHFAGRPMQGNEETRRAPGGIQVQSGSGKDGERATARIPQRVAANYNVMPVSSVNASMEQMRGAGRDVDKYKRLKQTMYKGGRRQ